MSSPSPEILDQIPPSDVEAERAVIGCCLLDSSVVDNIATILAPEDFYSKTYGVMYRKILQIFNKNGAFDALTLHRELVNIKGDTDWAVEIAECVQSTPVWSHHQHYAEIVKDKAQVRRFRNMGERLLVASSTPGATGDSIAALADRLIMEAADQGPDKDIVGTVEAMQLAMDRIDAMEGCGAGLPIGFRGFDGDQGGLFPGELTILAARPSVGKTSFALQVSKNVALSGKSVVFISLEMSAADLMTRMLCGQSGVDSSRIRTGRLRDADRAAMVAASHDLQDASMTIVAPAGGISASGIKHIASRHRRREDLDLLVIDYMQLLTPESYRDSRQEQVSRMARMLKLMATDLDVPIMCLSQLNREVEKEKTTNRPKLSHLRESGAIEQDADNVWFIHREELYNSDPSLVGNAEIIVSKNRRGTLATYELLWDGPTTQFSDPLPENHEVAFDAFAGNGESSEVTF